MNYKYLYHVALIFFVFSCEDSKSNISVLEESLEKWNSHNLKSYRMNLNIVCNCIPTPDIDIRVDDGKISLINANGSSYANPDLDSTFWHAKTVDELFSFIDEKLLENPYKKTLKFNSKYGYPEEIFFDIDEMPSLCQMHIDLASTLKKNGVPFAFLSQGSASSMLAQRP